MIIKSHMRAELGGLRGDCDGWGTSSTTIINCDSWHIISAIYVIVQNDLIASRLSEINSILYD